MWTSEDVVAERIRNAFQRVARPVRRFTRRLMYRLEAWYIELNTLEPFYPWDWRDDFVLEDQDSWFIKREKWVCPPQIPPKNPYRQFHIDTSTLSKITYYEVPTPGWDSAADAPDYRGDAVYFPERDVQEHLKYIRRPTYEY